MVLIKYNKCLYVIYVAMFYFFNKCHIAAFDKIKTINVCSFCLFVFIYL